MSCLLIFSLLAQELSRGWLLRALYPSGHCHASTLLSQPEWASMAMSPSGAGTGLWQGEVKERRKTQPLQPRGPLGQPCRGGPNTHTLSHGCTGLTFVTEPSLPASFALAVEVAHEVLADLGPLLIAGVWRALVRQV